MKVGQPMKNAARLRWLSRTAQPGKCQHPVGLSAVDIRRKANEC